MRILQIISVGSILGGAEKSVAILKQGLEARGHQVLVIASDYKHNDSLKFSDQEFRQIDSSHRSKLAKLLLHLWYRPAYQAVRRAVQNFKPDIVHFHTMGQLSPAALFAVGKTPATLTVHGPEEYTKSLLEWYLPPHAFKRQHVSRNNLTLLGYLYYNYHAYIQRPLYVWGFRKKLQYLVAPSKYMTTVLTHEKYKVSIKQLYNGIPLPKNKPIVRENRLVYVGRLERVKGVHVLLDAMVEVAKSVPDVQLEIIGDGLARGELEAQVVANKIQKHVVFHGWVDNKLALGMYYKSKASVIPSIWPENLPTVCIEALAAGRPVVGTNTGGIPELIKDGKTGRIVPADNIEALSEALIWILKHKNLARLSEAASESMQIFSTKDFIDRIVSLYKGIIE